MNDFSKNPKSSPKSNRHWAERSPIMYACHRELCEVINDVMHKKANIARHTYVNALLSLALGPLGAMIPIIELSCPHRIVNPGSVQIFVPSTLTFLPDR